MLEGVGGLGRCAAPEREARVDQLVERAVELGLGVACNRCNELVAELPPDRCAYLSDFFCCGLAIETRRERVS